MKKRPAQAVSKLTQAACAGALLIAKENMFAKAVTFDDFSQLDTSAGLFSMD